MGHPLAEHLAAVLRGDDARAVEDARLFLEALVIAGREAQRTGRPATVPGITVCGYAVQVVPDA